MNSVSTQAKRSDVTPIHRRPRRYDRADILVFVIPCLQFIHIKVIGVLEGSDLLMLAAFLNLAFRGKIRIATPSGKRFLVLCSMWLASQIVTDIVRSSAFADYARGWSMIGLTLIGFVVLYTLLYERPHRLVLYGWGLVVGSLLMFFISPSDYEHGSPWKFGISFPLGLALFLLISSEKCRGHWPITLSALMGVINIYLGARSQGEICLVAASYLFATRFLNAKRKTASKVKAGTILVLVASVILGLAATAWAYQYAASAGILGAEARDKYELESGGKYGVLLGGRPDLLGALPAIYDSPILGHGSWARDWTYVKAERMALVLLGYKEPVLMTRDDFIAGVIPAHSYLLQAWVWAGIAGALFWAWVFVFTARTFIRIYPPTTPLLPLFSLIALSLLWEILFSPFGEEVRIIFPYYMVMVMTLSSLAPRKTARAVTKKAKKKDQRRIATSTAALI
jgi:predicted membrane protein